MEARIVTAPDGARLHVDGGGAGHGLHDDRVPGGRLATMAHVPHDVWHTHPDTRRTVAALSERI